MGDPALRRQRLTPEGRALALALGASLALHALALALLDPAFRRALAPLEAMLPVIEARLVARPEAPPSATPEAPSAPPPVLKDTLRDDPPPPPAPRAQRPAPPKPPPAPPRPAPQPQAAPPRTPPEPLPPRELGETYRRLAETLLYPEEAVRRGLEGEVVLLLEVDAGGRIAEASVASSSGHAILDQAALRAVRLLGVLGPASAGKAVLLPVRFQLD
jgi:protein TonB